MQKSVSPKRKLSVNDEAGLKPRAAEPSEPGCSAMFAALAEARLFMN
jgi:hypothetical protein